jgi:hypothetical protein
MAGQSAAPATKPQIFILCLDEKELYYGLFDKFYSRLIDSLACKARLLRARTTDAAKRYLSNADNRPIAILITEPGVAKPENGHLLEFVKSYVRWGGVAIMMASFSSFIRGDVMDEFWSKHWNLSWRRGDYYRTDVHLNRLVLLVSQI